MKVDPSVLAFLALACSSDKSAVVLTVIENSNQCSVVICDGRRDLHPTSER